MARYTIKSGDNEIDLEVTSTIDRIPPMTWLSAIHVSSRYTGSNVSVQLKSDTVPQAVKNVYLLLNDHAHIEKVLHPYVNITPDFYSEIFEDVKNELHSSLKKSGLDVEGIDDPKE